MAYEFLEIVGYDITQGRPKLRQWMEAVKNETNPLYDEVHKGAYFARKLTPFVNVYIGMLRLIGR